jgi:phosphoserine phosphatase
MQPGILSGGFQLFADHLKDHLGLDYAFGNQLEIKGNTLTGRITGEVIDAPQKARLVNWIADQGGIPLDQTVAIGDGPTMPSCSVRRGWELPTMPGRSSTGLLLGIS